MQATQRSTSAFETQRRTGPSRAPFTASRSAVSRVLTSVPSPFPNSIRKMDVPAFLRIFRRSTLCGSTAAERILRMAEQEVPSC
jgi:hypothetical protein